MRYSATMVTCFVDINIRRCSKVLRHLIDSNFFSITDIESFTQFSRIKPYRTFGLLEFIFSSLIRCKVR